MKPWVSRAVILVGLFLSGAVGVPWVEAGCEDPTQGSLCVVSPDGKGSEALPLKHTEVRADISGLVGSVEVRQTFTNPSARSIEAIYVFPLPEDAAVNDFLMTIGDRTIRGLIKPREEARRIYDEAKARGHVTGLLEQERPNVFTQSVANIESGKDIVVSLRYVYTLRYDRGKYEFVFPMVVGPRYIPGSPISQQGGGWSPDTDRVPDASRITPPVLKPGERSGHDIHVEVEVDAGVPIQDIHSTSHRVEVDQLDTRRAKVALHPDDTIPNKDFVLRYAVAGSKPEMALLAHRVEGDGYFLLMIQPKSTVELDEVTPKELIFVLDTSGSMSGEPIAKVKEAMRHALLSMNPDDAFQIIQFNNGLEIFPERPMPNTKENRQRALSYINGIDAGGGTDMLPAIERALKMPGDSKRLRIVCLMTDGYIGNEREIFAAIQRYRQTARVFTFGVGSSVNRYLVTQAAKLGRGEAQVVRHDEPSRDAVKRFYDRLAKPYLTDIEIDWGTLKVRDLYPIPIPDLFADQPLILKGRYSASGRGTITLKGRIANQVVTFELPVVLPEREPQHEALASLWARTRIEELEAEQYQQQDVDVMSEITALALTFRLMSQYTSFVAVEEQRVIDQAGQVTTVQVPLEMPEGVSYHGVFGEGPQDQFLVGAASGIAKSGVALMGKHVFMEQSRAAVPSTTTVDRPTDHKPLASFAIELTVQMPDGASQVVELTETGEVWLSQRDISGNVTHRRLTGRLIKAQLRDLWEMVERVGLTNGSTRSFGRGKPRATLTTSVEGRATTWTFGSQVSSSDIPSDVLRLLELLGVSEGTLVLTPAGGSAPPVGPSSLPVH